MARIEEDKEDLIADGVAMVERAEFARSDTEAETSDWNMLTTGFRRNGDLSIYLDQTYFYQFDTEGRLRRAHVDRFLYRSQGHTLAQLHLSLIHI